MDNDLLIDSGNFFEKNVEYNLALDGFKHSEIIYNLVCWMHIHTVYALQTDNSKRSFKLN